MERVVGIMILVAIVVITYTDWSNPDKKAEPLHPGARSTVNANNERKHNQILELQARINFLNAKYPDKKFYREGALVKERSGASVPSTKGYNKNSGDKYLAKNEIPYLLSILFRGQNNHEISWSKDRRQLIFKFGPVYREDEDYACLTRQLLSGQNYGEDEYGGDLLLKWVDQLKIYQIDTDVATMRPRVAIEPSRGLLEDEDYLRMEVENHGRVFIRNSDNEFRWLLGSCQRAENKISRGDIGWNIQLTTSQKRPTAFSDLRVEIMKRDQIIANIESRFWCRKRVESFSDDGKLAILRVI